MVKLSNNLNLLDKKTEQIEKKNEDAKCYRLGLSSAVRRYQIWVIINVIGRMRCTILPMEAMALYMKANNRQAS